MFKQIKIIFILGCIFLFSGIIQAHAIEFDSAFVVKDWNSDIILDENDCYHITETIQTQFYEDRHGIYRTLPKEGTLNRDGIKSKYRGKISNIIVTNEKNEKIPYKIKNSFKQVEIKIGDPNKYANENSTYIISYDYDVLGDRLKDGDEAYFNIIGNEWTSNIDKLSFSVKFPKPINKNKIGVRVGYDIVDFSYDKSLNTLSSEMTDIMWGEGVSFRVLLPDNYFKEVTFLDTISSYIDISNTLSFSGITNILLPFISILTLIFSFIILFISKIRKEKIIEIITVTPPKKNNEQLNSYEMTRLLNDDVDSESILSMLFDLANKGYISIKRENKKNYIFYEDKKYDGQDTIKKEFMDRFFNWGKLTDKWGRKIVTTEDLTYSFYKDIKIIEELIREKHPEDNIYKTNKIYKSIKINSNIRKINNIPLNVREVNTINSIISIIGVILCFGGTIILPNICIAAGFAFILAAILLEMARKNRRRVKEEYKQLRGQIAGFKKFLKEAEKSKLEQLINENPNYFYDTLSYAYALGVTKTYAKNFENINIEPPKYYSDFYSDDPFMLSSFANDLSNSFDAVSLSPSTDGGGSFSGGSGSGGGGGGSW